MSLMRWNPTRDLVAWPSELMSMQREMNRVLDNLFRGFGDDASVGLTRWNPAVDISEGEDSYHVKVELPGVRKEDVRITLEANTLTITGEKKQEEEKKEKNFHRVERSYGSFQRSFTLPSTVRADRIEASFKDGILAIELPKSEESRPKQIDVKVS